MSSSLPVPFDTPARYFQTFWLASRELWQSKWDAILDVIGDDPYLLWVPYTVIYTFVVYWVIGLVFTLMDIYNKPAFLRRYKIQPGTNEPVDRDRLIKVIIAYYSIIIILHSHFIQFNFFVQSKFVVIIKFCSNLFI